MKKPDPEYIKVVLELARSQEKLGKQAYDIYKVEVEALINSNSKDINKIEHTLDYLLGFCFNDDMLLLYRKLCQHLYFINESLANKYIQAYIDMWDEGKNKFGANN